MPKFKGAHIHSGTGLTYVYGAEYEIDGEVVTWSAEVQRELKIVSTPGGTLTISEQPVHAIAPQAVTAEIHRAIDGLLLQVSPLEPR